MSRSNPRHHIQLDFSLFDDPTRLLLAAAIAKVAPSSDVYTSNPVIQDAVTTVSGKAGVLKQRNTTVAEDRAKLRDDTAQETLARSELDGAILALATLTEVNAKSPADLVSMAFKPLDTTRSILPPEPPAGIDVEIPKRARNRVTVSAHQSDRKRRHYEAEQCPYGADTWTRLVGTGKTRTLRGPSGTQIWVRFATVRGEEQSAFCTPVLVTIP